MRPNRSRGQAYTLEGVVSAVIVLSALLYGLQVVDVGPWTSETTDQTSTLETQAQDVLDLAASNGTLNEVVRCYGVSGTTLFSGGNVTSSSTTFERILNQTFDEQNRDYNVYFYYWNATGGKERVLASVNRTESDSGVVAPTSSAAVATRTIALYDDMPTRQQGSSTRDCAEKGTSLKEFNDLIDGRFYLDDIAPNSPLFNIVEVRLVVW